MKRPQKVYRRQELPDEFTEAALNFIRRKFYDGDNVQFSKDRRDLQRWVIWKLARYLESRGVTLPIDRYREIVMDKILMEALRHGNTTKVNYVPGWLKVVVDRHLAHNGDGYYEEGKAVRDCVARLIMQAGQAVAPAADAVRQMAQASKLLGPRKRPVKAPGNDQLTLL